MSFELSSIITGLQKEGHSVARSGKTNAQRVAGTLQPRLGGEPPLDLLSLQLRLVDLVEGDLDRLLQTDASYVRGVVGSRLQIQERDAVFGEAFGVLSNVRSAVEGVYGDAVRVKLFGDVSALPADPEELHRLGLRIQGELRGEHLVLPQVQLPGFQPLDRVQLADGLALPLGRLGQVLSTLGLERKDTDVNLHDKSEGVEEYRRTVRFVAGCLASLYGLAGLDDLAAKIRPRRRAPRRPNGSGPDATGTAPAGSGSESDGSGDAPASESSDEDDEVADPASGAEPGSGPIGIVS